MSTVSGTTWEWNLAMNASLPSTVGPTGTPVRSAALDRALAVVASLEAIACSSPSTMSSLGEALAPIGVAHAHGDDTPTRMATPHIIDLLETGSSWAVSVSHPPPDRYCWVRVTIGPADRDTVGMPTDENLTDAALMIRGRQGDLGATPDLPFEVTSTRTQSIDVPLRDAAGNEAPLVVSGSELEVAVDVWLQDPDLLAGVDLTASSSQGGLFAITNLLASVHVVGCSQAPCTAR